MIGLLQAIPAQYRKIAYLAFALAVIVVTAVQVWYGAIPDAGTAPEWTSRALAVLAYIGGALGVAAAVNVGPGDRPPPVPGPGFDVTERGEATTRTLVIAALVGVVLILLVLLFDFQVNA